MIAIPTAIDQFVHSELGQAFGLKEYKGQDTPTVMKIWGDFALKMTHWIPGVGFATGLLSFALLVLRVKEKNHITEEDMGELIRSILAICSCCFTLAIIDATAIYMRHIKDNKEECPHTLLNFSLIK